LTSLQFCQCAEIGSGSVICNCDRARGCAEYAPKTAGCALFRVIRVHNDANLWIFSISNHGGIGRGRIVYRLNLSQYRRVVAIKMCANADCCLARLSRQSASRAGVSHGSFFTGVVHKVHRLWDRAQHPACGLLDNASRDFIWMRRDQRGTGRGAGPCSCSVNYSDWPINIGFLIGRIRLANRRVPAAFRHCHMGGWLFSN
jgi:hypothetical protein